METSFFTDLNIKPVTEDLIAPLDKTFPFWLDIRNFVFEKCPVAIE